MKRAWQKYLTKIHHAENLGVLAGGSLLQRKVILALSTSAGGVSVPVARHTPGGNVRSRTLYTNPSRPGQPPHARSGNLRRSIFLRHDRIHRAVQVGWPANAIYGYYHEMGITYARKGFQRRPHLLSTLAKEHQAIRATINRVMRQAMR